MSQVQSVVRLGPADWVTLVRAGCVCGVVALLATGTSRTALAVLLTAALLLDWVDGRVARSTGTASDFGARFDMEVDAALILVLSVGIAGDVGWWVLGIGLVRYVFAALVWLVPRLQSPPPPRPWCKVVAALVGIVLSVVVVGLLPSRLEPWALVGLALLLAESFGREARDRWRASAPGPEVVLVPGLSGG